MTGSAKQSIAPLAAAWIASSLSLLAMTNTPPFRGKAPNYGAQLRT
jgi:hypothetical protein